MGTKRTKRERKFMAKGGVKGHLDKGTITKKGKLRQRKKAKGETPSDAPKAESNTQRDRSDDFVGDKNLGQLDMDSFFAKLADDIEHGDLEEDGDDDQQEMPDSGDDKSDESSSSEDEDTPKQESQQATQNESSSSSSSSSDDSISESESDDDDLEAAEARMKKEMASMSKADPDFHKFLKENEESLLDFGEERQEEENDEEEADAGDEDEEGGPKTEQSGSIHLTPKVLKSLAQGTFKSRGISSLRKLIGAYKSACHLADPGDEGGIKKRPGETGKNYVIEDSKVFDQLMVMCLNRLHEVFRHHLEIEGEDDETAEGKPISPKTLEKAPKWNEIRPLLLSFYHSSLHVISEAKEPELLTFILKALSNYFAFLTPFPRVAEAMLKSLTQLWSAPLDTSEDYQVVRLNAFFRIRQMALTQPFPFIEDCLKKTYLAYAQRAKFATASSVASALPTLTFMGNCLVELYSLDYHSSYQHAFVYIRQLALLLRTALQKKTSESFQQVYCWQYVHCLKLWVAVLSSAAGEEDGALMRSLIYPLSEIIMGTARLAPSPTRHLPLRFQCVRLLQQLAAASESFIPTTSLLLDALELKEWHLAPKKSKAGSARGLQVHLLLKLPKEEALRTNEQLEACLGEWFMLMQREVDLYRYSAGFPEFSMRIVQCLRRFAKETRNSRWRTFGKGCIDTCERYAAAAVEGRSKLAEAPKDVVRLECLLAVGEPSMRERHEASVEKERKSQEARASEMAAATVTSGNKKKKKRDEPDEDEDKDKEDEKHEPTKTKKKKKKSKNPAAPPKAAALNEAVLDQQDEVQEGVDWMSDED